MWQGHTFGPASLPCSLLERLNGALTHRRTLRLVCDQNLHGNDREAECQVQTDGDQRADAA